MAASEDQPPPTPPLSLPRSLEVQQPRQIVPLLYDARQVTTFLIDNPTIEPSEPLAQGRPPTKSPQSLPPSPEVEHPRQIVPLKYDARQEEEES